MDLTEEQKALILENKGVISDLTELTNIVFPGEGNLDGRTKEGRAVRAFLLDNEIEYETKHVYPKEDIPLTEEQGEFILNSAKEGMDSFQIASILFPDAHVKRGGREFMTIHNYLEATSPSSVHISEDVLTKKYSAPKAISKILKKINDYCSKDIEESKLNVAERKSIESLGGFLSSPRFIQVINNYDSSIFSKKKS